MVTTLKHLLAMFFLWPMVAVAYYFVYRIYGMEGVMEVKRTRQMPEYAGVFGFLALFPYWFFLFMVLMHFLGIV